MAELDETEKKLTKKAGSDLSDIENRHKAIVDISEQLEFLIKHGSESQILMLLNTVRVDISKQENDFQNLIPSYECIDVNFKASRIKSALNSLDRTSRLSVRWEGESVCNNLESNKLHRLSKDGKLIDILLKKEDGLNEPFAVAFNNNYTKLYIANGQLNNKKQVLIFECA
ncbi:unnamed protein product [Mytilus edulis]|uniref:Uncharacterized protein n=1 Tax=Mytilus edulis TaxID=6550 RepID=A0A8S3R9W7_MYTED|nr:unnamed protein product [Mytilus edulis]